MEVSLAVFFFTDCIQTIKALFTENLRSLAQKLKKEIDFNNFFEFLRKLTLENLWSIALHKNFFTKITISQSLNNFCYSKKLLFYVCYTFIGASVIFL